MNFSNTSIDKKHNIDCNGAKIIYVGDEPAKCAVSNEEYYCNYMCDTICTLIAEYTYFYKNDSTTYHNTYICPIPQTEVITATESCVKNESCGLTCEHLFTIGTNTYSVGCVNSYYFE